MLLTDRDDVCGPHRAGAACVRHDVGDGLSVHRQRERLTASHALDDLAGVVAQLPNTYLHVRQDSTCAPTVPGISAAKTYRRPEKDSREKRHLIRPMYPLARAAQGPVNPSRTYLIEMLVSILIIGVLAAIAIPAFLNTRNEAGDAPAKELAGTARTTIETLAIDNAGSYATANTSTLHTYEPTIATTKAKNDAYLSAASGTATTYKLTISSAATSNKFLISRETNGIETRTCTIPKSTSPHGGCQITKGTTGTW